MRHDRPGVRRVEELDLSYEAQQAGGVAGNAVVRPAGEMELTQLPDLVMALLETKNKKQDTHGTRGESQQLDDTRLALANE